MEEKQHNLMSLREELKNKEAKTLSRQCEALYRGIIEDGIENVKLPVHVFETNFLNFFIDMFNNNVTNDFLLKKWLEIAGGYYSEVDLIDNVGNVVLTVPGLLSTPDTNLDGLSSHHITNMGDEILKNMKISPVLAENTMVEAFSTLPHIFNNENPVIDSQIKWKSIFLYFSKDQYINKDKKEEDDKKYFSNDLQLDYD